MTTTKITYLGGIFSWMAAIILVTTWNIWALFESPEQQDMVFGVGIAIALSFLVWAIHLSTVQNFKRYTLAFLLLCFSNVVDELFFDPTTRDVNEYIAALLILFTAVFYDKIIQFNTACQLRIKQIGLNLNKLYKRCRKKIGLHTP
jgi:uncharacterized membrane protein